MREQIDQELSAAIQEMKSSGVYKYEAVLTGRQGTEIIMDGKKMLNFCANNYLGLAGSDLLVKVAKDALDKYGFGSASVRFICGTNEIHKELEAEVARFFQFEDSMLYGSCFDANAGIFETLLRLGDVVVSDELNHASIIDGIKLCKATCLRYKHMDLEDLAKQLNSIEDKGSKRVLIVTDGVFSVDGDIAPLEEICRLAEESGALVMVDDSHGSGVLGENGRGSLEARNVLGKVDILNSTFGKALGGAGGGFTASSKPIIEYLRQKSRPYLFSNALPFSITATALYVLHNFEREVSPLRKKLADNTKYFKTGIEKMGFVLGGNMQHPITLIMLGDEKKTMQTAEALIEQGIYVRGFTYPVVAKGKARIRVQISAAHTREHLDRALLAFRNIKN